MWKNSIAEIFVPTGSDGNKGEVATGYPVAPNLVLTAYHAVFPTSAHRDESRPIEVRWHHPRVGSDWQLVQGIVWGDKRWDLALLECALPSEISICKLFPSDQKPMAHQLYEAVGFPRIGGKRNEVRNAFHIQGSVYSMLEADDRFDLEEPAGPIAEENWKGASGSPVVVNGRILGVIVEVPPNLEAKRLQAVPMWKVLRDDADFCQQVGYRQRQERLERMRQRIEQQLDSAEEAIKALIAELPESGGALQGKGRTELVGQLLNLEVSQLILVCKKAYSALGGGVRAKPISATVQTILPTIYDHGVVETVRSACGNVQMALLTLPTFYPTVAEVIMAGVDGRETLFCERQRDDDFPKGKLNLPEPPEGGFDPDGMETIKSLDEHLRKFSWQNADAFSNCVDDFMVKSFPGKSSAVQERSWDRRIKVAAREIKYQADNGRTHYLIVNEPQAEQDRIALENTLSAIRGRYQGLMCFSLNTSDDADDADYQCFRPLLDMLPKKQRNTL